MTKREFYENIINSTVTDEVIATAKDFLAKMDAAQASRSSSANAKRAEINKPILDGMLAFFEDNDGIHTAAEVSTALEISVQKASALLRQMVASGLLTVEDVNVPKRGKQKGYKRAQAICRKKRRGETLFFFLFFFFTF